MVPHIEHDSQKYSSDNAEWAVVIGSANTNYQLSRKAYMYCL